VVPVTLDGKGGHKLGGSGGAVEWAVRKIRLPASHRGDRRLEAASLALGHLSALAERLARESPGSAAIDWAKLKPRTGRVGKSTSG
jgi:hypothetical protein